MREVLHEKFQAHNLHPGVSAALAGLYRQERDGQLHFMILTHLDCVSICYIHAPWHHCSTPVRLLEYAKAGVQEKAI